MNEWKKPPKVLTLREMAKEAGISLGAFKMRKSRLAKKGKGLEDIRKIKDGKFPFKTPLKALNGMTQSEAARLLGVSRQRVNEMVKKGKRLDRSNSWIANF